MTRWSLIAALIVPVAGATALAGDPPGTLNFADVTASRIVQNVEAFAVNEKDIDVGDFDEDGDLDVVIANAQSDFGTRTNKLYENIGGTFHEITTAGAIPGFSVDKVSRKVFFRDFDGDTHLDIYVINDQNSHPDQVFIADWTGGSFNSFVETVGTGNTGAACSGWSADFDGDGDIDVYCGNYPNTPQDKLMDNDGAGVFTSLGSSHVPPANDYVVDVNGADMNGDGTLDLLISNHGNHDNWIYYNNNNGAGSGAGDFNYANNKQSLGNPITNENSMTAGDFDGDDDLDIYWSNAIVTGDRIWRNDGNDVNNMATFTILNILPASTNGWISRKVRTADFNDDGRLDALVMKEAGVNSRPTVLRNVGLPGEIEFVDWTPAAAFPSSDEHMGWHAVIFDTNGDGDKDIFMGGTADDHLFENVPPVVNTEAMLIGGVVPNVFNQDAFAILGSIGLGESDTFTIENVTSAGLISIVHNGADDYLVEILDAADTILYSINRGPVGVEEAGQYDFAAAPDTLKVRVTGLECANAYNVIADCGVGIEDFLELLSAWGPNPGHPADYDLSGTVDIVDFLALLANWGDSEYVLELLVRSG